MSESGRPGVQGVLAMLLACVIVFAVALSGAWHGHRAVRRPSARPARWLRIAPRSSRALSREGGRARRTGSRHARLFPGSRLSLARRHLNGWVQLLTSKGPQKKEIFDPKSFFAKDQAYDPSAVSGAIVIALKEPTKEKPAVQECLVSWHVQVRQPNKLIVGIPGSFTGTVPPAISPRESNAICKTSGQRAAPIAGSPRTARNTSGTS